MPEPGKKVLPTDEEIAEKTGKTLADWFALISSSVYGEKSHGEIVEWLLDEHKLSLFYAHAIGHKWQSIRSED